MTGLITKISLKNFMSHDRWELDFKKDIIFIGGENGAGKSAILAAMSLCFGGNARSTNRSTAIGSFVQREKAQAVIAITIRNTGNDAYEPELYGDCLTIERTINEKGSAPFKIRDAHGMPFASSLHRFIASSLMHRQGGAGQPEGHPGPDHRPLQHPGRQPVRRARSGHQQELPRQGHARAEIRGPLFFLFASFFFFFFFFFFLQSVKLVHCSHGVVLLAWDSVGENEKLFEQH
jgi:hypothetical protein